MAKDNAALAAYFDRCAAEGAMAGFSTEEEARIERLLALWNLRPGERVVEPGCGAGRLTERLARAVGPEGHVLAFDISRGMIERAQERGLPAQVTLAVADVAGIPAADASFDVAICFNAFPHFADPAKALSELARVLVPGVESGLQSRHGISGGAQYIPHGPPAQLTLERIRRLNVGGAPPGGESIEAGGRLWVNHLKGRKELNEFHRSAAREVSGDELPDDGEMRRLLSAAGFEVQSIEDGSGGYSLFAVRSRR
jgi:SAM-dependent methyltransferase